MSKTRAHVFISGFVQGVGFRFFAILSARKLGVSGIVRNLTDGRVEVVAEGKLENVKALIERLRKGPPGANVVRVDVRLEKYKGEFSDFSVEF